MQCPSCGHPKMLEEVRDQTIFCGGQTLTVRKIRGKFCPHCDEGILDSQSYQRIIEAQRNVVNAARAESGAEIRRIRKRLRLTQAKLAENFGLRPLAVSLYERGKIQPPTFPVKLMRLVEMHPTLLQDLREMEALYSCMPLSTDSLGRGSEMAK
jgi:HTH-type transcriptional regulator / antitoxin MqsA